MDVSTYMGQSAMDVSKGSGASWMSMAKKKSGEARMKKLVLLYIASYLKFVAKVS